MKKITIFLSCLLFSVSTFAQYESFFGKNSTTFRQFIGMINTSYYQSEYIPYSLNNIGCNYELLFFKNDTVIINDTLYFPATINIIPFEDYDSGSAHSFGLNCENCTNCNYFTSNIFFREDTINGRLYRKDFTDCGIYTKEILVCDMSLEARDTFNFTSYSIGYYAPTIHYLNTELIVDSVNYINDKKIIYFGYDIAEYYTEFQGYAGIGEKTKIKLQFIEGIGVTHAMNSTGNDYGYYLGSDGIPYLSFSGANSHFLLCKYMDDTLTFMTNPILGCFQEGNSNAIHVDVKQNKLKTEIHCNLENNILHISFPENIIIQQGELCIIDILGHVHYNKRINNNNPEHINISNLSLGVYILLYSDGKNRLLTKFVKIK